MAKPLSDLSLALTDSQSVRLSAPVSVSCAILAMHLTKTMHPPGGATSINANITTSVASIGFLYIPVVLLGSTMMLLVALLLDNIPKSQRYPAYWC
jgi:CBS-domain-containing membrane protein